MFTQILIPLDGSDVAERALPYVEELARRFGSTVLLLRATTSAETLVTPPDLTVDEPCEDPAASSAQIRA
jgi:nucleotide-binding universal stress UspA family protein